MEKKMEATHVMGEYVRLLYTGEIAVARHDHHHLVL